MSKSDSEGSDLGEKEEATMDQEARARLEEELRRLCDASQYEAAASALLRGYGPEIFGFLCAVHQNETDANDAFSELAEALWRGLPEFAWRSSVRTWAYAVARNIARTRKRDAARRGRRVVGASDSVLEGVAEQIRTQTKAFLRTENKTRLQALRDGLPDEDRMLLVLRVDRGLAWNDLARILSEEEGDAATDDASLAKEAARLRKRFQLVKERLREMAKREGLLE
jgi:RNA polymerase sigma-70 factor (ECF subfamily)